ncbi:SDR family NAD(P)-dependent oxidoreductase [Kiloniella laminariae]|uniref:SDR family NAD(P)-dependent oxidoreductase n=1 Tax=Kiloniella laminariae TaxID=454162 RepID=UPI0003811E80|nr:SDR family NAD(P)-dependent oxidoreductase [Kiloniella laminariae]
MTDPKTIFITGASSGIGAALAENYAGSGVMLYLTGRDRLRLDEISARCQARGAKVQALQLDVRDADACATAIEEANRASRLDLVIANAGISGGTGAKGESAAQTREIMDINVIGVMNTVLPAIAVFKASGGGQIAIVSSLASFKGLPSAPAYCASKAAVRSWGEGLRGALKRDSIRLSVITPGFVVSRITDANRFPMPFLMTGEKAAGIIARGLRRNKPRIAFPLPMYLAVLVFSWLPLWITEFIADRLPKKQ